MTVRIIVGDCRSVLATMDAELIDVCITDPPYGLGFMGAEWDRPWAVSASNKTGFVGRDDLRLPAHWDNRNANCRRCGGQQRGAKRCGCDIPDWDRDPRSDMQAFQDWSETWARAVLRVLKPGAHLLAMGGSRTEHRMTCAIEDAGFEIRDKIVYLHGEGFPKSLDVSKQLDKMAGAERKIVGPNPLASQQTGKTGTVAYGDRNPNLWVTAPATDLARHWDGWGSALKPAMELIVLARKPLRGTVAVNVARYGTGAINIDACRIGTGSSDDARRVRHNGAGTGDVAQWRTGKRASDTGGSELGRWPSNVILGCCGNDPHDPECPVRMLDAQSGERPGGRPINGHPTRWMAGSKEIGTRTTEGYADSGTASRFFLNVKPDKVADPTASAGALPIDGEDVPRFFFTSKSSSREREPGWGGPDGVRVNTHPT